MKNNNKTKGLIIIVDFEKRKVFISMLKKFRGLTFPFTIAKYCHIFFKLKISLKALSFNQLV